MTILVLFACTELSSPLSQRLHLAMTTLT